MYDYATLFLLRYLENSLILYEKEKFGYILTQHYRLKSVQTKRWKLVLKIVFISNSSTTKTSECMLQGFNLTQLHAPTIKLNSGTIYEMSLSAESYSI